MGLAVHLPADGKGGFTLCCVECGRTQEFKARFMGCRVRELGRAQREGWGFREGVLVEERLDDGGTRLRVARLCPTCAVIERHAREGGTWGYLLAELRAARAGVVAAPVEPPAGRDTSRPVPQVWPSGQLDLFGLPA